MAGIPQNARPIYNFLIKAGFSSNAAAGILGNIEQESGGDPHAQGGGLIQILGHSGGTLAEQLQATMTYIKANGSVADINAHASSPGIAAWYFSTKYERPNAALANNANREASANLVAHAAKTGNWPQSSGNTPGPGGLDTGALAAGGGLGLQDVGLGGLEQLGKGALGLVTGTASTVGDIATALQGISRAIAVSVKFLAVLGHPSFWLRMGAFLSGVVAAVIGMYFLGKSIGIKPPAIAPIPV